MALRIRAQILPLLASWPNLSLHLHRCPGHKDVPGNDRADLLAKAGYHQPSLRFLMEAQSRSYTTAWQSEAQLTRASAARSSAVTQLQPNPVSKPPAWWRPDAPRYLITKANQFLSGHAHTGEF